MAIKFVDKDPEDDKPKKATRPAKTEAAPAQEPPKPDAPLGGPKKRGRTSSR